MALVKCHECGKDVSTQAAACPGCGVKPRPVPKPSSKRDRTMATVVALVGVGIAAAFVLADDGPEAQAKKQAEEVACTQDLSCWGERNSIAAEVRCPDRVERLATHSVHWRDGTKMTHFRWKDKSAGIVTYLGDRAEFQNGFGAYTPVVYECDFDPATKTVLDVRASEGRLP